MEIALDYLIRLWPVAVAFVGLIAWLVKVDGRTMQNAKNLERVEKEGVEEMARLESRIDRRRTEDMARIDQSLSTIMTDIKTLLRRGME